MFSVHLLNWQMTIPDLLINCIDHHLWLAVLCIIFNPLYWNVVCSLIISIYILSALAQHGDLTVSFKALLKVFLFHLAYI